MDRQQYLSLLTHFYPELLPNPMSIKADTEQCIGFQVVGWPIYLRGKNKDQLKFKEEFYLVDRYSSYEEAEARAILLNENVELFPPRHTFYAVI